MPRLFWSRFASLAAACPILAAALPTDGEVIPCSALRSIQATASSTVPSIISTPMKHEWERMPKLEIRLFRLLDDGSLQLAPRRSVRIRRIDPYSGLSYQGRSEAHECLGAIGMTVPDHPDQGSDCIQLGVVEPTYAGRSRGVLVMGEGIPLQVRRG